MNLMYVKKGEDKYAEFKRQQKIKEKFEKEKEKKHKELKESFTKQLPSFKGKMKYRSGNPLKKFLSGHRATIKVGGNHAY